MDSFCLSALVVLLGGLCVLAEVDDQYSLYSAAEEPTDTMPSRLMEKRILPQWYWPSSRSGPFLTPAGPLIATLPRTADTKRQRPSYHPMTRFRFADDISRRFVEPAIDDDRIKKGLSAGELMSMLRGVAKQKGIMGRLKGMRFGIGRR